MFGIVSTLSKWPRGDAVTTLKASRNLPWLPRSAWRSGLAAHTRLGSLPPDPTILRIVCVALFER
ncbi:MAG: hypothetical protein CL920_32505 [Deltaproteobacteria bacterium]|nr:hypothetical protein [Deltaproteobacteria bacterium]